MRGVEIFIRWHYGHCKLKVYIIRPYYIFDCIFAKNYMIAAAMVAIFEIMAGMRGNDLMRETALL